MENKNVIYFLAGFGTVSLLVFAYNKFVAKKQQPLSTDRTKIILN